MAQLHDVVYVIYPCKPKIFRFNATTHERLTDIDMSHNDMIDTCDIAVCERTSRVYVSDFKQVWRVSADGEDQRLWLPKATQEKFKPGALSVTATRLLVVPREAGQLRQFDAAGDELRRIQLPEHMHPSHAVESPTRTLVISHGNTKPPPPFSLALPSFFGQHQVSEVNTAGQVLRHFTVLPQLERGFGSNLSIALDSQGNVFVGDTDIGRILLLDAQLALRRVIIDEYHLTRHPKGLRYVERSGQLLVGQANRVAVFDVLRR